MVESTFARVADACPPPWTGHTAVAIPAGDTRLHLNGRPLPVACRVLSEENYQVAMAAVNAMHAQAVTAPALVASVRTIYSRQSGVDVLLSDLAALDPWAFNLLASVARGLVLNARKGN